MRFHKNIFFILLFFVCGCISSPLYRPSINADPNTAILTADDNISIKSIDGKNVATIRNVFEALNFKAFEQHLLPGKHSITVRFDRFYRDAMFVGVVYSKENILLSFDAKAGHVYSVRYDDYNHKWEAWIEDVTNGTGVVVSDSNIQTDFDAQNRISSAQKDYSTRTGERSAERLNVLKARKDLKISIIESGISKDSGPNLTKLKALLFHMKDKTIFWYAIYENKFTFTVDGKDTNMKVSWYGPSGKLWKESIVVVNVDLQTLFCPLDFSDQPQEAIEGKWRAAASLNEAVIDVQYFEIKK